MRWMITAAIVVSIFVLNPGQASAASSPEFRCQQMLAKSARKYVKTTHTAELACADAQASGAVCNQSEVDASEQRAADKLQTAIVKRCTSQTLAAIGFPAQCTDDDGAPFTPADAAECVRTTHVARIDAMIAIEYPGAGGPLSGDALACQMTIGASARKLADDHLKARQRCLNNQLKGRLPSSVDCYDESEVRDTGDAKTDQRLGQAVGRLYSRITSACQTTDPDTLGFPGDCDDLSGGGFSVDDVRDCMNRTHGFLVVAMAGIEYAAGTAPTTTLPPTTTMPPTTTTTEPGATTTTLDGTTTTMAPPTTTLPSFDDLAEVVAPSGDADGDGYSNAAELAACSSPSDPASTPENDNSLCLNQTPYSDNFGPAWGNTDRQTEPSYNAAVTLLGVSNAAECGQYCATTTNLGSPQACVGQWPWTGVPDQAFYEDGETLEVSFPDEDGNMLNGRIYLPPGVVCTPDSAPVCDGVTDAVTCTDSQSRTFPAVVICPGFIGNQPMYNWAAHRMAVAGYITMTFDPSGQGRSQGTFPNPDEDLSADVDDASPFSRDIGTATNFIVSAANPVRDLIEIDPLLIVNQGTGATDHTEPYVLGNAGHSFGARGSITYQQSTESDDYPVRTRAVVGWSHFDNAGTIGNVPVMLHSGDEDAGFIQPPGSGNIAPEMERRFDRLGGDRDLDSTFDFTPHDRQIVMIADATHISWSQGPYFYYPTWAEEVAYHYTLAWFDKYLHDDVARTMSDVAGNVINSVDEFTDYAECFGGPNCFSATERLKMVHPHLSDTWCSRYDIGGDVNSDVKGGGCQTQ